jgi:hypothetical protein
MELSQGFRIGQVKFRLFFVTGIRRKINYTTASNTPRQVVIRRQPTEGFGFVIISSMARNQPHNGMQSNYPVLGRILDDSPAQHGGELHVGDKILAGQPIRFGRNKFFFIFYSK